VAKTKKLEVKSLNSPDEVRTFGKGKLELVKIGGATIGRAVLEPGWKWSEHVKPIAKTKSCKAPHFQYHVSGTLHVVMDDGTEKDIKAGEISVIPPGHDGWVVGDEPAVVIDFQGMAEYAKQPRGRK
jgi:quercetin dioxygenase-like cupin family protein